MRSGVGRGLAAAGIVFAALAVLAVGCGETVVLGEGTDLAEADAAACGAKDCGDSCIYDPCLDRGSGGSFCNLPSSAGYCNDSGKCVTDAPTCTPWVPCHKKTAKCGDKCWPCDPKSPDCQPPEKEYTCTDSFSCLPGKVDCTCVGIDCPAAPPCQGLGCGDPCECDPSVNSDCPQGTTSPTFCDANGRCLPVEQVACPKGYQPCENKLCGQTCSVCEPGNKTCKNKTEFVCDAAGECTVAPVSCAMPCTPARCGAPCLPCEPSDPGCNVPGSAFCDEYGACRVGDAPYCPCADKDCGDACVFCDPDGSNCSTDDSRACDLDGNCVVDAPVCQ